MKRYILFGALAATMAAAAQDITTEVVVERTVVPVERAATRPRALVPALSLPGVDPVELHTAGYSTLSPVVRSFTRLQPAAGLELPVAGPWRGYVSAGYFPTYNLGVAAGYRAIDTDRQSLAIHMNFNGMSYKQWSDAPRAYSYNGATAGADYSLRVGGRSTLSASLDYTFASTATFFRKAQSRNAGRLGVAWQSAVQGLEYDAYLRAAIDAFSDAEFDLQPTVATVKGLGQQDVRFGGKARLPLGEEFGAGLALNAGFLHSSVAAGGNTAGIIGLRPFVDWKGDALSATAGVNLDFFTGDGAKLYVSPKVELAWTPAAVLTVKAAATGGTGFNTATTALDICPLVAGIMGGSRYRVPLDLSGAIVAGPFAGFTATIDGGYAKADDWLMPGRNDYADNLMLSEVKGWHAGLTLDYSHRLFGVHASAEVASSDLAEGKGYYLRRDGARLVVGAGGHVKPLDCLQIGIDYEFRDRRHTPWVNLGCVSDLALRADWRVSPAVDIYANVENILGRTSLIIPTIFDQKLHGLVGVTVKF